MDYALQATRQDHLDHLVEAILNSGYQGVMTTSGGGVGALWELVKNGGSSSFLLDAAAPWSTAATDTLLGRKPEQYCNAEAARQLAMAAYQRARKLAPEANRNKIIGVGVTCALAKKGVERAGRQHKAFIAAQTSTTTFSISHHLRSASRLEQENLTTMVILQFLASQCQVPVEHYEWMTYGTDLVVGEKKEADPTLVELLHGDLRAMVVSQSKVDCWGCSSCRSASRRRLAILPGSFNPRHDGHNLMHQIGYEILGCPVDYEISITNADKPPLDYVEIDKRLAQFHESDNVILTNAPTFLEKARLFPDCTFLVGIDTWNRINNPKYCGIPLEVMFQEMKDLKVSFLVFGRKDTDGSFRTLDKPHELAMAVPEDRFRLDISSTELRKAR